MQKVVIFEGKEIEILELNGEVLFNAKQVGEILDMPNLTIQSEPDVKVR